MPSKVIMVSIDALRPEAVCQCGHPFAKKLLQSSAYTLCGSSIVPSVTLPCHASMFFSVGSERHGITINQWVPQVRPIPGLMDCAHAAGKKTAMCYTWDFLRDLAAPGSVDHTYAYTKLRTYEGEMTSDRAVTREAIAFIRELDVDILFLYLSATDWSGHRFGWMSEEYMGAVYHAFDCLQLLSGALDARHSLFCVTDHGGHDRTHGTLMPEDMRIPLFFLGDPFSAGEITAPVTLLDLAPTAAHCLGIAPCDEWEGRSILMKTGSPHK